MPCNAADCFLVPSVVASDGTLFSPFFSLVLFSSFIVIKKWRIKPWKEIKRNNKWRHYLFRHLLWFLFTALTSLFDDDKTAEQDSLKEKKRVPSDATTLVCAWCVCALKIFQRSECSARRATWTARTIDVRGKFTVNITTTIMHNTHRVDSG